MSIHFLRIKTERGLRYIRENWELTVHPAGALSFNFDGVAFLHSHVAQVIAQYGQAQFVEASQASCQDSKCDCAWTGEKPNVRARS